MYLIPLKYFLDIHTFTAYCHLPKESGDCKNSFPAWYYDHLEGVCKEFVFGGCGGNKNRFTSKDVCESSCSREGIFFLKYKQFHQYQQNDSPHLTSDN